MGELWGLQVQNYPYAYAFRTFIAPKDTQEQYLIEALTYCHPQMEKGLSQALSQLSPALNSPDPSRAPGTGLESLGWVWEMGERQ